MKNSLKGGKWPLYKVLLACALTGAFSYAISKRSNSTPKYPSASPAAERKATLNVTRLKNQGLIQPLLMAEVDDESVVYTGLKEQLQASISRQQNDGVITRVSVYLFNFNQADWMSINKDQEYDPGSIMKLPILLAYLRKAESNPGLFDRKILYTGPDASMPEQTIVSGTLIPGKHYSIRELLRYMLVESDNQANALLNRSIEPEFVFKVFSDLGLQVPKVEQSAVKMNIVDVSKFLRVLFNSSYTGREQSEYAMQLLTKTKFSEGMKKAIPDSITLVHKFGERGYRDTTYQELHETGIIYVQGTPVLLTIMTGGNDQARQAGCIRELTGICYNWVYNSLASH
ncbi:MAG: serine hydrolase [Bacteroidia bacterium]|nr:serine hydrolase [Bacteroidia bacterium]